MQEAIELEEKGAPSDKGGVRESRDYGEQHLEDELEDDATLLANNGRPGLSRSRASSLNFDFSSRLILNPSSLQPIKRTSDEPIGIVSGVALIIGLQIGSGIFSSTGVVSKFTGSVGASLLLWLGAGLLSWAGASSFAELGEAIPLNGGAQAYLEAQYGSLASYCFSITALLALKPGSQAIIAIIFGEYLCRLFYHTAFSTDPNEAAKQVPLAAIRATGIIGLFFLSALQAWSAKAGTRAQLTMTVIKVIALVLIFVGGLVFLGLGKAASSFDFDGSPEDPSGYALALFAALWVYDGFDQANYVAKDCKPGSLPTIIHTSMATVVVLFICANISYFLVLPFAVVTATQTIGLDFGRAIAGPTGGVILALIISISCLGALNGSLYTSSRLVVAAAEQGYLPRALAKYNERQNTPLNGILISSGLSTIFILIGDFAHLSLFYGVCAWFWNLMVVVGLLVLRVKEPGLNRPYRVWIVTPILFASTALFLIVLSCFSKPLESLAAFAFISAGAIPWYIRQRTQRNKEKAAMGMT